MTINSRHDGTRAFTLKETLVVMTMVALIALIVAPAPRQIQIRYAQPITCADRLGRIGDAVHACFAEHNGYGPTADDGDWAHFMLTWTDLLYDMSYLPDTHYQLCPADEHPDPPTEERGSSWCFYFVDQFGVNEPIKRGVRTSYALNYIMSENFKQDRFEDESRQIYAMDGWWTWHGNINAAWAVYEEATGDPPPNPIDWPTWEGTMNGWRHGADHSANVLYLDGHVELLTPHVPVDPNDLMTDTVDTVQSFTWLPGERTLRSANAPYQGSVEGYVGCHPYFPDPDDGTYRELDNRWIVPIDYPEELHCTWRTIHQAWQKLPNQPRMRR